jgi:type IV secretory pathway TraG/TraD family ATPase VirD4
MSQLKVFAQEAMFKSFDVLQFFEVNGDENIRFIKELAGIKTVKIESSGESKSNKNINSSINKSISKTDLLSTDFIRELKSRQILFYPDCPVIVCDRTKYYEHKKYKGLAAPNLTRNEMSYLIPQDNEEKKKVIINAKKALKKMLKMIS